MDEKPFELRILGLTELTRADGSSADGIIRQPKRLALLAYLAITTAKGYRRRDEIIGLFWPELDQAQGRTYLRKSLHAIREELGEDVFVTRGDDEIRVNEQVLWCDAAGLPALVRDGNHRAAVDLYRGELLSALYPEGVAQEFEEWLRQQRKSLTHQASTAAWECVRAEEAKGDTASASVLARKALEIEPDNEEGVRHLITLLDKRGDRAGALRFYQEWQAHLQDEFGVEPAPETRRLARAVQAARKGESHETPPAPAAALTKSFTSELIPARAPAAVERGGGVHRSQWVISAIGLILVAATAAMIVSRRDSVAFAGRHSVAVLPLRTIGGAQAEEAANIIAEELTTLLAMDSALVVRSGTDAIADRDRLRGVAYVVEGAVQRTADRVRVTLRLTRTSDAITVWAKSYDSQARELAPIAQDVSKETAAAVHDRILAAK